MDCCTYAANWVREASGKDVFARYRGLYRSAAQARRLVAKRGGMEKILGAELTLHGFERVEHPDHGDIGIVNLPEAREADKVFGASAVIRFGSVWVGRTETGIIAFEQAHVAVWKILK